MSHDPKLGPPPDALAGLLDAERRAPAAPVADRARVWAAIAAKLPPGGGSPGSGPPGGGTSSGRPGGGTSGRGGGAGGRGGGTSGRGGGAGAIGGGAKAVGIGAVAAIGAVAIWVGTRSPAAPKAPAASVPQVASAPAAAVVPAPAPAAPAVAHAPAPTAPIRTPPPAPPPRAAAPARTRAAAGSAAASEDVLIERARVALARSRFDEALAVLAEHERRFPHGPLRSERELLIVRALLGTSNRAAAVERANQLRHAHPDDPALPAIDAVLAR